MKEKDPRLAPILTARQTALLIGEVPTETIRRWARPTVTRQPLVATGLNRRGWPTVPLVGLAEAHTTNYLLGLGLSIDTVARFAAHLRKQHQEPYPFAVPKYVTDGTHLYQEHGDELAELFTNQGVFYAVLKNHLREIVAWPDGRAGAYRPARLENPNYAVEIDPRYNAGRLSFVRNRVPLFAVVGSLDAGDPTSTIASGYHLMPGEVEFVDEHRAWLRDVA